MLNRKASIEPLVPVFEALIVAALFLGWMAFLTVFSTETGHALKQSANDLALTMDAVQSIPYNALVSLKQSKTSFNYHISRNTVEVSDKKQSAFSEYFLRSDFKFKEFFTSKTPVVVKVGNSLRIADSEKVSLNQLQCTDAKLPKINTFVIDSNFLKTNFKTGRTGDVFIKTKFKNSYDNIVKAFVPNNVQSFRLACNILNSIDAQLSGKGLILNGISVVPSNKVEFKYGFLLELSIPEKYLDDVSFALSEGLKYG